MVRPRAKIVPLVAVAVAIAAWLWSSRREDPDGAETAPAASAPAEKASSASHTTAGGGEAGAAMKRSGGLGRLDHLFDRQPAAEVDDAGNPILIEVRGRTVDHVSGKPVPHVEIVFRARGPGGMESPTTSGSDGRYSIRVAPWRYLVTAFNEDSFGLRGPDLAVAASGRAVEHDIRLARLATVRGRVVDAAGAAIAGGQVTIETEGPNVPYTGETIARYFGTDPATQTDERGRFELRAMPGKALVMAEANGAKGRALVPDLPVGGTTQVVVVIDATIVVVGEVVDSQRNPVGGATVHILPEDAVGAADQRTMTTGPDGVFRAERLGPGRLTFEAEANGHGGSGLMTRKVVSGQTLEGVVLTLGQPRSISGRVLDSAGEPLSGVDVIAGRSGTGLQLKSVTSGADGSFTIDGLGEGVYDVHARMQGVGSAWAPAVTAPAEDVKLVFDGG